MLRAILRNAAWAANPEATVYSKGLLPGAAGYEDFKDGAGQLSAFGAMEYCSPRGAGFTASGTSNVNLTTTNPMPTGRVTYSPLAHTGPVPPQLEPSLHAPPSGSGSINRSHLVVQQLTGLSSGRIRFTTTWNGCTPIATGNGPSRAKTDFDVFLYNQSTQEYVAGSQSIDDTNEGFDYAIPSGSPAQNYAVMVAWAVGAQGCNTGSPGTEPIAYALRWGL